MIRRFSFGFGAALAIVYAAKPFAQKREDRKLHAYSTAQGWPQWN